MMCVLCVKGCDGVSMSCVGGVHLVCVCLQGSVSMTFVLLLRSWSCVGVNFVYRGLGFVFVLCP